MTTTATFDHDEYLRTLSQRPGVYRMLDALQRWAGDDLRSLNAQIEFVLRRALQQAGRLPAAKKERDV